MKSITETEIRLGNLVDFVGKPRKIKFHHDFMRARLGMFKPIPISPELLEKAGFVDISGDQVYAKMNLGHITFAWHIRLKTIEWASVDDISITHITTLHQLQNLYHDLTGEELKIEL